MDKKEKFLDAVLPPVPSEKLDDWFTQIAEEANAEAKQEAIEDPIASYELQDKGLFPSMKKNCSKARSLEGVQVGDSLFQPFLMNTKTAIYGRKND